MRAPIALILASALIACQGQDSSTRDPLQPQNSAPIEAITVRNVGEPCELSAPQACRTTQVGGTAYCWTSEEGPICRQEVPGKLGDICRSTTSTTLYICPENTACNMITNTCTDGPIVGSWWAPTVSIGGANTSAELRYHFEVNGSVSYDLAVQKDNAPVGALSLVGAYVSKGDGLDVTITYTSATSVLANGQAALVTEGTCAKLGNCDAFVFADNAAFPDPCVCKIQQRSFKVEGTNMLGEEFGASTTFYLER